jgi:hypothetical protein
MRIFDSLDKVLKKTIDRLTQSSVISACLYAKIKGDTLNDEVFMKEIAARFSIQTYLILCQFTLLFFILWSII